MHLIRAWFCLIRQTKVERLKLYLFRAWCFQQSRKTDNFTLELTCQRFGDYISYPDEKLCKPTWLDCQINQAPLLADSPLVAI